jgi:hypothetical protein
MTLLQILLYFTAWCPSGTPSYVYSLMKLHSWPEITTSGSPCRNLQRHVSCPEQWITKCRMCINLDKTIRILFTRRSHRHLPELTLFNHSLSWSRKVKYLRITFDGKLLWNECINNIANKISARISEFYLRRVPQQPLTRY